MKKIDYYKKIFKNKKILVTGHTGFKGSWLCAIFELFGAKVYGISKNYPTKFYKNLKLKKVKNYIFNLKNYKTTKSKILNIKPDYIFHLAAQSIVSKSYASPLETWSSNLLSFLNVLNSLRFLKKKCACVLITSDKCYKNIEKRKGYKEDDILGGYDNYSASKASCELLFKSYYESYFKNQKKVLISSARAGNVIGGGDWSKDRLVPDIINSIEKKKLLKIRNIYSTRPWQHVLEPLFGYINLSIKLSKNHNLNGESFNFGPIKAKNYSVIKILNKFKLHFNKLKWQKTKNKKFKESKLLNLNCEKAFKMIKWKSKFSFNKTIYETIYWYKNYKKKGIKETTFQQIKNYIILK